MALQDITLGQYFPTESPVHRLDPRTKLITVLILMTLLMISFTWWIYLLFALLLIVTIKLARIPTSTVTRNLKPFLWLFLVTFFLNLWYKYGHVLVTIPIIGLNITDAGLSRALFYTSRMILLILFASLLTLTTSPMEITDGLAKLLSPLRHLKVPVQEFAMMMTIAIRFIPLLLEEAERIRKAQMTRGASLEGNLVQRLKGLIPLILPLFLSAFRKADELALAMEARCYRLDKRRTSYNILKFSTTDYALIAGSLCLLFVQIITGS
ncbi:energy-coupling factor transporter transmembrane protein EcfT [candidate division KSB1 bacterium]|nr:MAG: energy-coupling factor transporter transmembrane protein EcfT [candidate division KSB1 bacterium]